MTHPGVALMVLVGIGLGACLYYMFADGNTHNDHQYHHEGGGCHSPPSEPPQPRCTSREERSSTRKRGSTASNGKSDCTICLAYIAPNESITLFPCRHVFHTLCITEWREQGPPETRNTCPNCREGISRPEKW